MQTGSEILPPRVQNISGPKVSFRIKAAKDFEKKVSNNAKSSGAKKAKILCDFKYAGKNKEDSLLGGGAFGKTYRMVNKLDLNEYAVKHVDIKTVQNILGQINPNKKSRKVRQLQTLVQRIKME